jgi:putative transcriptional regulator
MKWLTLTLSSAGPEGDAEGGARCKEIDMKTRTKAKRERARDLFAELSEGMTALAEARHGKRTLRTHALEFKPAPEVTPRELVRVSEHLKMSRGLFAAYLRTNARTLETWEQGRAKPNAQAALLINLVKRFPDTVERLAAI